MDRQNRPGGRQVMLVARKGSTSAFQLWSGFTLPSRMVTFSFPGVLSHKIQAAQVHSRHRSLLNLWFSQHYRTV